MSVFVTGGAGYIGRHMALDLRDAGENIVVLDNLSTGVRWVGPDGVRPSSAILATRSSLARFPGPQVKAILHFAAKIVVPEFGRDPLGYYPNNASEART